MLLNETFYGVRLFSRSHRVKIFVKFWPQILSAGQIARFYDQQYHLNERTDHFLHGYKHVRKKEMDFLCLYWCGQLWLSATQRLLFWMCMFWCSLNFFGGLKDSLISSIC